MSEIVRTERGVFEYRSVGTGEPILVLNGGHTNCNSPLGHDKLLLAHGYRLIIPSRPGYGKTPSATGKTAETCATALVGLLDSLEIERVIVLGISGGGPTALEFAGGHPERVSKVILQNAVTGGRFPTPAVRLGAYLVFNPRVEGLTWAGLRWFGRAAPERALTMLMGSLSTLDPAQVVATMSPAQRQAALALVMASRSGEGFMNDLQHHCGDLARIAAPTLIIASKYDGSVDKTHAEYAADHIVNAALYISPAESHLMWFSSCNPEIENTMLKFLQKEG